jgi:hypothetical protein
MLWTLYFWLMAALHLGSWVPLLVGGSHEVYPAADYMLLAIGTAQVAALYGYTFKKPLLSATVWQVLFPVFAIGLVATLFVGGTRFGLAQGVETPAATIFVSLFGLPLFLPMLIANRRYAFRSPDTWTAQAL